MNYKIYLLKLFWISVKQTYFLGFIKSIKAIKMKLSLNDMVLYVFYLCLFFIYIYIYS